MEAFVQPGRRRQAERRRARQRARSRSRTRRPPTTGWWSSDGSPLGILLSLRRDPGRRRRRSCARLPPSAANRQVGGADRRRQLRAADPDPRADERRLRALLGGERERAVRAGGGRPLRLPARRRRRGGPGRPGRRPRRDRDAARLPRRAGGGGASGGQGGVRREAAVPHREPSCAELRAARGRVRAAAGRRLQPPPRAARPRVPRPHRARPGCPFELLYRVNADPLPRAALAERPRRRRRPAARRGLPLRRLRLLDRRRAAGSGELRRRAGGRASAGRGRAFQRSRSSSRTARSPRSSTDPGTAGVGKEYVEAHAGNRAAVLDDYRVAHDLRRAPAPDAPDARPGQGPRRAVRVAARRARGRAEPEAGVTSRHDGGHARGTRERAVRLAAPSSSRRGA